MAVAPCCRQAAAAAAAESAVEAAETSEEGEAAGTEEAASKERLFSVVEPCFYEAPPECVEEPLHPLHPLQPCFYEAPLECVAAPFFVPGRSRYIRYIRYLHCAVTPECVAAPRRVLACDKRRQRAARAPGATCNRQNDA